MAALLRVLCVNLGKQSLRGSLGVGLQIRVECGGTHTTGLVCVYLFPLTLHSQTPGKSQALQMCHSEGAVVCRWGNSKEGGWRYEPH